MPFLAMGRVAISFCNSWICQHRSQFSPFAELWDLEEDGGHGHSHGHCATVTTQPTSPYHQRLLPPSPRHSPSHVPHRPPHPPPPYIPPSSSAGPLTLRVDASPNHHCHFSTSLRRLPSLDGGLEDLHFFHPVHAPAARPRRSLPDPRDLEIARPGLYRSPGARRSLPGPFPRPPPSPRHTLSSAPSSPRKLPSVPPRPLHPPSSAPSPTYRCPVSTAAALHSSHSLPVGFHSPLFRHSNHPRLLFSPRPL